MYRNDIDPRFPLILGFAALGIGTFLVHLNPASGYELSIFSGTPMVFWAGVSVALFVSVMISFSADKILYRWFGLTLGGCTTVTVVGTPIIRGYYWLGENDALSHLGASWDIQHGALPIINLRYPAVHSLGSVTSSITGLDLPHTLLLFLAIFIVSYFVFLPLVLRELTSDGLIVYVGVFSAFLLLQLNYLGVHMQIHPTSQAVMFAALVLYLFIASYKRNESRYFLMFSIVMAMFVLLHPQQAANFVIFLGAIGILQLGPAISKRRGLLQKERFVLSGTVLTFALFWVWTRGFRLTGEGPLAHFVGSLFLFDTDAGTQVASRGVSLQALGGSFEEVFLKMFLAAALFCLFAGSLMMAVLGKSLRIPLAQRFQDTLTSSDGEERRVLVYFTVGFVAITGLFFAYLVADITSQYFRHYGFMMVIVTVMGAIFLGRVLRHMEVEFGHAQARALGVAIVLVFFLLTIPVIYPSPYIYQSSSHVPESQIDGFERSFEYWQDGMDYGSIRSLVSRHDDAINGERTPAGHLGDQKEVPEHFGDQSLHDIWDEPGYLTVTESDRVRDAELYQGFRFSHDDFAYLETEPRIQKVQTNGEFDLYFVEPL